MLDRPHSWKELAVQASITLKWSGREARNAVCDLSIEEDFRMEALLGKVQEIRRNLDLDLILEEDEELEYLADQMRRWEQDERETFWVDHVEDGGGAALRLAVRLVDLTMRLEGLLERYQGEWNAE
jgi:hypothetical protein